MRVGGQSSSGSAWARRYGFAVLCVAGAFAIRWALAPILGTHSPFLVFLPAVMLAAWFGGVGPGLLAMSVGSVLSSVFFLKPLLGWSGFGTIQLVQCINYLGSSLVAIGIIHALHRSQARLTQFTNQLSESEERFRLLVAAVKEYAIFMLDKEGHVITWNAGAEQIKGYRAEEIVGQHFSRFYPPADVAAGKPKWMLDTAVAQGSVTDHGWRIRKDGSSFWASVVVTAVRDERGELRGFAKVTRDMTAEKAASEALQQSEAHLRRVLDNLFAFVGVMTADGTLIEANQAPLEAAGLSRADVVGKKFWDCYWWNYSPDIQAQIRNASERANRGEIVRFDVPVRMAGDARMWIDFQIAPLRDSEGRITHLIPSAMDITERRRAEEALRASEKRFRTVFENAAVGIGRVSFTDARWIEVNDAFHHMLGYTRQELAQLPWPEITHPDDVESDLVPFHRMAAGELETYTVEKRFLHKQGHVVWARLTLSLVRDAEGKPDYEIAIIEDITERRKAEAALRESEAFLRLIIESAHDFAIVVTDLDGKILQWNTGAEHIYGWPADQAIGHSVTMTFTPEDVAAGQPENERRGAIETGCADDVRWHMRYDGGRVYISGSTRLLRDAAGRPHLIAKFGTDLTLRKQMEDRLREAQSVLEQRVKERTAKLEESLKAMQTFTYSIAHDLRAPLRAMRGFTHLLREEYGTNLDDRGKNFSWRIDSAAERMDALINDLLQFGQLAHARISSDVIPLEKQVEKALDVLKPDIDDRKAEVMVQRPMPNICGDPAVLERVLTNVVSNALKFVPPDKHPIVRIHAEQRDGFVRLWVEDNGIGIEPQYHEQVFGAFQRLHGITAYPGTGMGLAIVRKGAELMGGRAGLESEPGKGTRFWIELPDARGCARRQEQPL